MMMLVLVEYLYLHPMTDTNCDLNYEIVFIVSYLTRILQLELKRTVLNPIFF